MTTPASVRVTQTMKKYGGLVKVLLTIAALAIFLYWYLLAGYFHKHLFLNKYGSKIGEPLSWMEEPFPIMDPDGAAVLVDYARNELAVVLNAPGDEGLIMTGNDTSGISVAIGSKWVEIPELANTCVLVEESGARIARTLKPGEAKLLFEELKRETPGHLRTVIPAVLGIPGTTTSATHAAGA